MMPASALRHFYFFYAIRGPSVRWGNDQEGFRGITVRGCFSLHESNSAGPVGAPSGRAGPATRPLCLPLRLRFDGVEMAAAREPAGASGGVPVVSLCLRIPPSPPQIPRDRERSRPSLATIAVECPRAKVRVPPESGPGWPRGAPVRPPDPPAKNSRGNRQEAVQG